MRVGEGAVIFLERDEVTKLCRPGEGDDTCIWLVVGSDGFECRYYNRPTGLVSRWQQELTVAKRDGCSEVRKLGYEIGFSMAVTLVDMK